MQVKPYIEVVIQLVVVAGCAVGIVACLWALLVLVQIFRIWTGDL